MSTLLIEGGRRLSGVVEVEGNKNAALPLLAACLLTRDECVLTNMPRIKDVEVMAHLLIDLGAQRRGARNDDASRAVLGCHQGRARSRAGRSSAWVGVAARSAAGAARSGAPSRLRAAIFRPVARLRTHLEALVVDGRACRRWTRSRARSCRTACRPTSIYLYEASVTGTETALLAAAAAPGRSEIRHAACEPHVVELCEFLSKLGVGVTGVGTTTIRVEGGGALHGAQHRLWGDYIEAGSWAVVAAVTKGEIDVRGARAEDMEVVAAVLKRLNVQCSIQPDSFRVEQSTPGGRGKNHDRVVARFSQRSGEPRDGAGDAGGRPHAGPRLVVRAAVVRARTAQRHARRSVSVRSASHHRHRSTEVARPSARQPRSPVWDGVDCGGIGGGRGEPSVAA